MELGSQLVSVLLLLLLLVLYYIYKQYYSNSNNASVHISEIYVYPVKSIGGFSVKSWPMNEYGLLMDRNWMIVKVKDDGGNKLFLTQREFPKMSLLSASLNQDLTKLTLKAPNHQSHFTLSVTEDREMTQVEIWNASFKAKDCGDEVAEWLTNFLGQTVRLVQIPQDHFRPLPNKYMKDFISLNPPPANTASFADAFPVLLGSETSLNDLNTRIMKQENQTINMIRFRPNFVVKNSIRPYEEDEWHTIRIGGLVYYNVKPCSRCTIPNVDYTLGKKDLPVRKILSTYRHDSILNEPIFCINLVHSTDCLGKTVTVGDVVLIEKWQEPRKLTQCIQHVAPIKGKEII